MKKLYVFDFDGTLINSLNHSIRCFNRLLSDYGHPDFDYNPTTFDYTEFIQYVKSYVDLSVPEINRHFVKIYTEIIQEESRPYDGVVDVLSELQSQDVTLAICSNREEEDVRELADNLLPNINFKYISGLKEGIPDKPDPYRLNEIIEKENISRDEVLYFGDKAVDILAAENAEIDMVVVTWGQGNEDDYNNPYPIKVISSVEEILYI